MKDKNKKEEIVWLISMNKEKKKKFLQFAQLNCAVVLYQKILILLLEWSRKVIIA